VPTTPATPTAFASIQCRIIDTVHDEPVEIAEGLFHEMLNALPPHDWRNTAAGERFKAIEPTAGPISAIYVRIADRHFRLVGRADLGHDAIIARVGASEAFRNPRQHDSGPMR